jgi:anaerobic selenocysteine-containing dehydrogenase/NAD-dependent dihydropyrimidine dehydrogenase PreA subunit
MSRLEFYNGGTSGEESNSESKYWQDVEEKVQDPKALSQEFPDGEFDSFSVKKSRRNFLKIMGFSVSALPLTGCVKIPVKKALPYLNKNDTIIPGVANWYASTWDGSPVLVKTREGRPIKIEGNTKSSVTMGGANARMQGSVLSLYDSYRYRSAKVLKENVSWEFFDGKFKEAMNEAKGGEIYMITSPMSSPSELALIEEFTKTYGAKHVAYSAVSNYAQAKANEVTHGVRTIAEYDFEAADVVVSIGADFLGTWGKSVQFAKQYAKRRDPSNLNKHIHVETSMSLTGSNADTRFTRNLNDQRNILLGVLAGVAGGSANVKPENKEVVNKIVKELKGASGSSLLVYGENNIDAQVIVNKINDALGNYGKTVKVFKKPYEVVADDEAFEAFANKAISGNVSAVLFLGVNPVYSYYNGKKLGEALGKIDTTVSFASAEDETSKLCKLVAPANHAYESWSDTQVSHSEVSFTQPVIQPLFGSRMATETLMALLGKKGSFYDFMVTFWKKNFFPKQSISNFEAFWNTSVHDGVVNFDGLSKSYSSSVGNVSSNANKLASVVFKSGLNVTVYEKNAIGDGTLANNPWLQEMPDPITKATWDNYAMVGPKFAKDNGIKTGTVVKVTSGGESVSVPAMVQPGQANDTVSIAVGYGRSVSGKVGKNLGANVFPMVTFANGSFQYGGQFTELLKTANFREIAQTQTHHSMEGRDIVREATKGEYDKNSKAGNEKKAKLVHIYPEHDKSGHQWAMAIDLNKCTGCSACIVSCNAENNIPVVGSKEVAMRREMHWMRSRSLLCW